MEKGPTYTLEAKHGWRPANLVSYTPAVIISVFAVCIMVYAAKGLNQDNNQFDNLPQEIAMAVASAQPDHVDVRFPTATVTVTPRPTSTPGPTSTPLPTSTPERWETLVGCDVAKPGEECVMYPTGTTHQAAAIPPTATLEPCPTEYLPDVASWETADPIACVKLLPPAPTNAPIPNPGT